jgi:hypothetical protein
MVGHQMHAAVLHGIGHTPRYELFPAPAASDGDAVVSVTAAALKPSDRLMANGVHYVPATFPAGFLRRSAHRFRPLKQWQM